MKHKGTKKDVLFNYNWSNFDHENFISDSLDIDWESTFQGHECGHLLKYL